MMLMVLSNGTPDMILITIPPHLLFMWQCFAHVQVCGHLKKIICSKSRLHRHHLWMATDQLDVTKSFKLVQPKSFSCSHFIWDTLSRGDQVGVIVVFPLICLICINSELKIRKQTNNP